MEVSLPAVRNVVVHFVVVGAADNLQSPHSSEHISPFVKDKKTRSRVVEEGGGKQSQQPRRPGRKRKRAIRLNEGGGKNFYVVKKDHGYSYTVFPKSGDVIATGVKDYDQIEPAVRYFERLFETAVVRPWKVVNSTHVGRIELPSSSSACRLLAEYDRRQRERVDDDDDDIRVTFKSDFFPGAHVKTSTKGGGSANVFNNGNYVLVGIQDRDDVARWRERLSAIMNASSTTWTQPIASAWSADSSWTAS